MNELLEDLRHLRTLYAQLRDWLCQSLNTHSWKYDNKETGKRIRRSRKLRRDDEFVNAIYSNAWDTDSWSSETGDIKTRKSHCRICGRKRWESVSVANGYVEKIQGADNE